MQFKVNKEINIGGFCSANSGKIKRSYNISDISKAKNVSSFCLKNSGDIELCFSKSTLKKKPISKFSSQNDGNIESSFVDAPNKSQSKDPNSDVILCNFKKTTVKNITGNNDIQISSVWRYSNDSDNLMSLEFNNQLYDITGLIKDRQTEPISIRTCEDLLEISKKIKQGDTKAASSYYIIENDINLKGRSWYPLGNMDCPFTGVFDGRGHKIYNFKVQDKSLTFAGFFGLTENAIISNLRVDGIVKTGRYAGGFMGMSKNSQVYFCSAVSCVSGRQHVGGFIGVNKGLIEGCYYIGKMKKSFPVGWVFTVPVVVSGLVACLYVTNPKKNTSVFNNVPIDPYANKVQSSNVYTGEGNRASFNLTDVIKFSGGKGEFEFGNPTETNQGMTIKVQITDQELINKIGKTGRTREEQKSLDSNESYDPSNARITISTSGLVPPGYNLQKLNLEKLPDGSTLPNGIYSGIALLSFFNYETNEKAMINSQIPIAIVVE